MRIFWKLQRRDKKRDKHIVIDPHLWFKLIMPRLVRALLTKYLGGVEYVMTTSKETCMMLWYHSSL